MACIEKYGQIVGPACLGFCELGSSYLRDTYGGNFFKAVERQMFAEGSTPEDRTKAIRALYEVAVKMASQ